ncbi:MAG: hypothetical protein ASARMPRED_002190 [Alectoria sarmentosa]|nr:MAG: hypothetical protein ASARMPRED_002190 [Alectoria sarmentosa]
MASTRAHFFGHTLSDGLHCAGTDSSADGEDIATSNLKITLENLHNPNQAVAANPAVLPITPRRPTPNSAKKRRQMPDLSRPTATPGHGAKMSMIFRDAATSFQGSRLSICKPSSNIKRPRLPLSQARSIKFGSTGQDDTMVSSGLGNPLNMTRYLGASCELEFPSSEVSRRGAYGVGLHSPTPRPLTKAGRTTLGTLTNQFHGEAIRNGGMSLEDTLGVNSASLPSQIEEGGKKSISSGFATPIVPTPKSVANLEEAKYPILENWRSLRSSSNESILGSDNEDLHSTHGVPLILPFPRSDVEEAPRSDIDTWLNETVEATTIGLSRSLKLFHGTEDLLTNDISFSRNMAPNPSCPIRLGASPSRLKQGMQSPSGASSNKESVSSSKCSSSPTRPSAQYHQTRTPSRFCQTNPQPTLQHADALPFTRPLTPQGHLSLPPSRKRARVDDFATSRAETEISTARRDFTIHEDKLAEALAQLSPDVERHRKGRGPKRERCMSYWDEDILQPDSQCVPMEMDGAGERMGMGKGKGKGKGKQVLDESKQAIELTMEKPFVKEAGSASFDFKA